MSIPCASSRTLMLISRKLTYYDSTRNRSGSRDADLGGHRRVYRKVTAMPLCPDVVLLTLISFPLLYPRPSRFPADQPVNGSGTPLRPPSCIASPPSPLFPSFLCPTDMAEAMNNQPRNPRLHQTHLLPTTSSSWTLRRPIHAVRSSDTQPTTPYSSGVRPPGNDCSVKASVLASSNGHAGRVPKS